MSRLGRIKSPRFLVKQRMTYHKPGQVVRTLTLKKKESSRIDRRRSFPAASRSSISVSPKAILCGRSGWRARLAIELPLLLPRSSQPILARSS